jgi:hypothetical protein
VKVRLGKPTLSGDRAAAWWFNPRDGSAKRIGEFGNSGEYPFVAPQPTGRGNDWVLVLDDAGRKFGQPGE